MTPRLPTCGTARRESFRQWLHSQPQHAVLAELVDNLPFAGLVPGFDLAALAAASEQYRREREL